MPSTRNPGRVAELWYLLLVLGGPLRLIYIPSKLFVHGNAAATASNIAAHEWLFRFGIISQLAGAVILIFLTLALYRLFKGVDQNLAVLVVILGGVMPALINFVGVVYDAAALTLVRGADFLSVFDRPQRDALALLFLRLTDHQNTAAEILGGYGFSPWRSSRTGRASCPVSSASGSSSTASPTSSSALPANCSRNTRTTCLPTPSPPSSPR